MLLLVAVVYVLFVCLFETSVSLCNPGCPETFSVVQAGLELRKLPASVSKSAGIKGVSHQHQFLDTTRTVTNTDSVSQVMDPQA